MNFKTQITWILLFTCILFAPSAQGQEANKVSATDLCASPRFEEIIAAIECKRSACPDPDGVKDVLYARACTEIDPETANLLPSVNARDDGNFNTQRTVFRRINDSYDLIEVLDVTRLDKPVKSTTLEPCACLEKIAARTQCKIELCQKENPSQPPVNPRPADEARTEPTEKVVVPGGPNPSLQGGNSCALNVMNAPSSSPWAWLILPFSSGMWLLGRRRCLGSKES